jgi:hypothetical protein
VIGPGVGLTWRDADAVGGQTISVNGFLTVATPGLTVQNTTPATLANPEQYGPLLISSGQSWDTNDAVSRTVQAGWQTFGISSPTPAVNMGLYIDSGAGAGWQSANIVFGSGRLAIGATPSTSGVLRLEHGFTIRHRNFANDNNLDVLTTATVNSVNNVTVVGNNTNKTIVRGVPQVKCVQTNAQALTATVAAAIVFDGTDAYDSDSMHDPASQNTRITFTTAGRYRITWNVKLANNSTLRTVLREGGSTELVHAIADSIAAFHAAAGGAYEGAFTAGQYVEVVATAGSSLNTSPGQTHFSAHLIGDSG